MDNTFKSPVVLSFCPGVRGLERGVERALGTKLRVAAYVEIEAFIVANLLAGMEAGLLDAAPIWSNLKTFNAAPFRGRIHGILGGYPCQPFSNSGLRRGESDPRHLYPFISRCIKKSRPIWCFFENVEGHISLGFESVQKDLRKMGYSVEAGLYSAAEAGAPHRRNRLFILAVEKSYLIGMRGRNLAAANGECEIQTQGSGSVEDAECQPARSEYGAIGGQFGAKDVRQGDGQECSIRAGTTSELAYSGYSGHLPITARKEQQTIERGYRWPARPGEEQHEWEEPRTIESPLGCTVNGYNYREDFIRALGNSVVEQTAEIALKDLLRKHGISNR